MDISEEFWGFVRVLRGYREGFVRVLRGLHIHDFHHSRCPYASQLALGLAIMQMLEFGHLLALNENKKSKCWTNPRPSRAYFREYNHLVT